jgi:hypothetical protein
MIAVEESIAQESCVRVLGKTALLMTMALVEGVYSTIWLVFAEKSLFMLPPKQ